MKYQFIKDNSSGFSVERMAKVLKVSRSGYPAMAGSGYRLTTYGSVERPVIVIKKMYCLM